MKLRFFSKIYMKNSEQDSKDTLILQEAIENISGLKTFVKFGYYRSKTKYTLVKKLAVAVLANNF